MPLNLPINLVESIPTLFAAPRRFQSALSRWYRASARPLPWRTEPSLYRTVVSEFMCQQTQIKTVLPYFERWMQQLPDFATLAAADESQVLRLWEGLGYYSRARNLHRLGREVASRPQPPRSAAEWDELPGIGPYTAAAISSLAFGESTAVVDGNVVRVLSRLTADATEFRNSSEAVRHFSSFAAGLIRKADPGVHNQALMELGALVCTPRNPRCSECPVRKLCRAAAEGNPEAYPRFAPKQTERQTVTRLWCLRNNALLLHRIPATSRRLAGQHELPRAGELGLPSPTNARSLLATKRRSITRFQITESIHATGAPRGRLHPELIWIPFRDLGAITLSGPHRRWIQELFLLQAAERREAGLER